MIRIALRSAVAGAGVLAYATLAPGTAHAVAPAFSDGDFAGFTAIQIPAQPATDWSGARDDDGGNPGSFWQSDDAGTLHFNYNPALVYDPADGAIQSLTFDIDYRHIPTQSPTNSQGFYFGLIQNGVIYDTRYYGVGGQVSSVTAPGWTNYSPGIGDGNIPDWSFSNLGYGYPAGTPSAPDFSENGAPIYFGFTTGSIGTSTAGYDNFSVVVNVVPEPASAALVAGVGALLLGLRRRSHA